MTPVTFRPTSDTHDFVSKERVPHLSRHTPRRIPTRRGSSRFHAEGSLRRAGEVDTERFFSARLVRRTSDASSPRLLTPHTTCGGARSTGPRRICVSVGVGPLATRGGPGSRPDRSRPSPPRLVKVRGFDEARSAFPLLLVHPQAFVPPAAPGSGGEPPLEPGRSESSAVSTDPRGTIRRASVPAFSLRRRSASARTRATSSGITPRPKPRSVPRHLARPSAHRASPVDGTRSPCRARAGARARPVSPVPTSFVVVARPPGDGSIPGVHTSTETSDAPKDDFSRMPSTTSRFEPELSARLPLDDAARTRSARVRNASSTPAPRTREGAPPGA